ncbi:hypothetical protein QTG56_24800 (plasmid) [Rossellomorea sp. AcN35-11]|nr:hypothetical protein [Rossellomorea aquimaris]WJV31855.1 hypothetical protein QTG56_24800 [Rossellomorea sp. AcN35-11]
MQGIKFVEGRSIKPGEKVSVHFNIHKGGFSIVSMDKNNPDKGRVCAHSEYVQIEDATFHVSAKTLEKIKKQKRKAVYARVRGIFVSAEKIEANHYHKGYCNPYKTGVFVDYATRDELKEAKNVYFYDKFFSYLPIYQLWNSTKEM